MGNYVRKPIVRDGLVLYLDAANTKSYPGSGTLVKDLSGQSNNGTLTNGVGFNSLNAGSFTFDGSNRYIDLGDVLNPGVGSYTINLWLKVANTSSVYFAASKGTQGSGERGFSMYSGVNSLFVRVNGSDTTAQRAGQTYSGFTNNSSYFQFSLVINRSNNTVLGYYNGSNQGWVNGVDGHTNNSISGFGSISSTFPLAIGRAVNTYYLNGNIPIAQIYNRALSAIEVLQNFNAHRNRFSI
jgi:hypothetical protein